MDADKLKKLDAQLTKIQGLQQRMEREEWNAKKLRKIIDRYPLPGGRNVNFFCCMDFFNEPTAPKVEMVLTREMLEKIADYCANMAEISKVEFAAAELEQ